MPAGHGFTDVTAPATGLYTVGEADVTGAGAGGTFSDFLGLITGPLITFCKTVMNRLTALEAKAILQRTTNQSIANGTNVVVTYDAGDLSNTLAGAFNISHSTGALTCTVAGTYKIEGTADYASNATGARQLYIQKALAASPTTFTILSIAQPNPNGSSAPSNMAVRTFTAFAVGDILELGTLQTSGAALNLTNAHLEIKRAA